MTVNVAEQDQVVAAAIKEISHIATLPEITLKIVELVEDPKSTAQDLHKIISTDPALCSRILKVVNSSFYGLPGQIGSINRAIVMLGLNAVKNIAIAASLAKLFRGGDLTPRFSARSLWNHCNATAAGCKVLAEQLKLGLGDEAFLAGLIHDIGMMVEMQFDRNRLIEVVEKIGLNESGVPTVDMIAVEDLAFGANHQDFGACLSQKWKFPKTFAQVAGYHHRPLDLAKEHRTLSCLVFVADRIAGELEGGMRADLVNLAHDPAVLDHLRLSVESVTKAKERVEAAVKSGEGLLA
jgi:HD-like signal output (HDOD) protein